MMRVEDSDLVCGALAKDPADQRCQKEMSRFFGPAVNRRPRERFAMLKEIFHMEQEGTWEKPWAIGISSAMRQCAWMA